MEQIKQFKSVGCNTSATLLRVRACKTRGWPLRQVPSTWRSVVESPDRPKTCSFTFSSKFYKCNKRRLQPRRTKSNQSREATWLSSRIPYLLIRSERRQIAIKFMPVVMIKTVKAMNAGSRSKDERPMRSWLLKQLKQMALSLSLLKTLPCLLLSLLKASIAPAVACKTHLCHKRLHLKIDRRFSWNTWSRLSLKQAQRLY